MNAARHLTVRNVPENLARALDSERRKRGISLNQTVLDLLSTILNVGEPSGNGLSSFAGGWSSEDLEEFKRNTSIFGEIDEEMWK